jgi:hypothetical protein
MQERGAGHILPGVWGTPQSSNPPRVGVRGLKRKLINYPNPETLEEIEL